MLDKSELLTLIDYLGLPRRGSTLVLDAHQKAPVRQVASRGGNVVTLAPSKKSPCIVATESRSIEFLAAIAYEFDAEVLAYYAQPCELKLELIDESTGDSHKLHHFPDFLVLRRNGVSLVEWKSVAKLERLAQKYPWRYQHDGDGRWCAPQLERQLSEWGIDYRIQTDADLSTRWTENILSLQDYYHPAAEPCPPDVLECIRTALKEESAVYLHELYHGPYQCKPDHVLKAIADHDLVVDLERELVTEPRRCRIYRDEAVRELLAGYGHSVQKVAPESYEFPVQAGVAFAFDGKRYEISLVGANGVVLTDLSGNQTEVTHQWLNSMHEGGRIVTETRLVRDINQQISNYFESELRTAMQRQAWLERDGGPSERTKRRWRQKELSAQLNGSNEIIALVPRVRSRGNRQARLSPDQEGLMMQVIKNEWLTNKATSYAYCYSRLKLACDAAGLVAPSQPTLIARIKSLDHTQSTRVRHGNRRAYQEGDFVAVLNYDTPRHGSRPYQYCHIDHTQIDIELISSVTGRNMGRPWLSLAIDSYTRRILGFYLTFDPPSYHSNMMVLRDIVRRHGRLPQFIVADNGKDFHSTNFETFLMAMDVYLRFRPAGRPRHGAVMERLFGRVHSEYIHNLAGNTKATKNVRMTTGKYLPVRLAEWTLESMYFGLEHWAFEYYDQDPHPALGLSPRAAHEKGIAESGARSHRHLVCNTDFLIATCPAVDKDGTRKVDRQRGVKVDYFHYFAPEFRDLRVADTKVPVRYDPWDGSSVYARVNGRWVRCICNALAGLGLMTYAERTALTDEYRHLNGMSPDTPVSLQRLREFHQTFTPEGAMVLHMAQQSENKRLYGSLGQAAVLPPVSVPITAKPQDYRVSQGLPAAQTNTSPSELDGDLPEFEVF